MKLTTIALAAAFTLSSTFAFAYTSHHRYRAGARTYYAGHSMNYGRYRGSYGRYRGGYYGSPNNRGGLVGGSDAGTYRP